MLIAQGTTQLVAGDTTVANSSPPVTVEVKTSVAPSELSALMSTTALVASHADNCDSSFTHTYIHRPTYVALLPEIKWMMMMMMMMMMTLFQQARVNEK